jgi:hypothetical protein
MTGRQTIESIWDVDNPRVYMSVKTAIVGKGLKKLLKITCDTIFCNVPKSYPSLRFVESSSQSSSIGEPDSKKIPSNASPRHDNFKAYC